MCKRPPFRPPTTMATRLRWREDFVQNITADLIMLQAKPIMNEISRG